MSRPEILYRYFEPVGNIKGVGERYEKLLAKLGLERVRDMLFDIPEKGIERVRPEGSLMAYIGKQPILHGEVGGHKPSRRPNAPYRVRFLTDLGDVDLTYFKGNAKWLAERLPLGAELYVSGRLEEYQGQFQISHPEFVTANLEEIPKFEPQYGLTEGISQKQMQKIQSAAMAYIEPLAEWLRDDLLESKKWPSWDEALRTIHHPKAPQELAAHSPARERLAYDELLSHQLALALTRLTRKPPRGRQITLDRALIESAKAQLPYNLTGAQIRAVEEIYSDFASPKRMFRLLQGDVGAGKTAVAYLAMAAMAQSQLQSVMIAPTEILARQHYYGLKDEFSKLGMQAVLLTGSVKAAARREVLEALKTGEAQIAFGTHALFQEAVEFSELGLAVIDEQHRFGVAQRAALTSKGQAVDLLAMSATPIPRSLAMTLYGEMDISILDEKPPSRSPVQTSILSGSRLDDLIKRLEQAMLAGRQAYWVCPLVQESEMLDLTAAEARYEGLKQRLPNVKIGLVHGQMPNDERDDVMARFAAGEVQLLVATTVIEVGVDVPNATIMAIEAAERFGLSQLHQLRGRVGRGSEQSYCILIYSGHLGATARERLEILRETDDGFKIADADMRIRGPGDLLGRAQSGLPRFQIANLENHGDLLKIARDDAQMTIDSDPKLATQRGEALRVLLYLQERDRSVELLRKS